MTTAAPNTPHGPLESGLQVSLQVLREWDSCPSLSPDGRVHDDNYYRFPTTFRRDVQPDGSVPQSPGFGHPETKNRGQAVNHGEDNKKHHVRFSREDTRHHQEPDNDSPGEQRDDHGDCETGTERERRCAAIHVETSIPPPKVLCRHGHHLVLARSLRIIA